MARFDFDFNFEFSDSELVPAGGLNAGFQKWRGDESG
jgi:hypothetical protein